MEKLVKLLDKASRSKFMLWVLNRVLWKMIPFNAGHKLKVIKIEESSLTICLPYRNSNLNHLKGIHACALATVCEYVSGLQIARLVNPSKFRLIMKELKMDYQFQGKTDIHVKYQLSQIDFNAFLENIQDKAFFPVTVQAFDLSQNLICEASIIWQVKKWESVKTR